MVHARHRYVAKAPWTVMEADHKFIECASNAHTDNGDLHKIIMAEVEKALRG